VIQHGLVSAGRYLSLTVRFPDRPGSLATLVTCIADSGANVLEVVHRRTSSGLAVDDVEVSVDLETRGAEHSEQVLEGLRRSGYTVRQNRDATGASVWQDSSGPRHQG
jgi:threonine dehydratase